MNAFKSEVLEKFAINITTKALSSEFDPVVQRDLELRSILGILCRKNKNNPILIGKPGVGKTAVVEALALALFSEEIPHVLKNKVIYSLSISDLVAGTSYRGEFEERLNLIISEVKRNKDRMILFIDEIHNAIGAGSVKGTLDVANILKPAISRAEISLIGATTTDEYANYIQNDKAFERRFQKVFIDEPDEETAILMLNGTKENYEKHHKLSISQGAIVAAVHLAKKYITDRSLPDSALDLLDLAASDYQVGIKVAPISLINIRQEIMKLEFKLSFLNSSKTFDKKSLNTFIEQLQHLKNKQLTIESIWLQEKEFIRDERKLKKLIESYIKDAKGNLKMGYESKHHEITNILVPLIEQRLKDLKTKIDLSSTLVYKEELKSEDIMNAYFKYFQSSHSSGDELHFEPYNEFLFFDSVMTLC